MLDPRTLKPGDRVRTQITGFVGLFLAEVVAFDPHRGNAPILQVLTADGKPDNSWPMKLKAGDYIIESLAG